MNQHQWQSLSAEGEQTAARIIYREHFYAFARRAFSTVYPGETFTTNWHIETICFELQELMAGHNKRLIINVPPRHLKSFCAVIAMPAYLLGQNPSMSIIVATYSQDLGTEHGERLRRLMNSQWYQQLFPATKIQSQSQEELRTTQGGARRNVTPRSSTTGFGADYIIIDDIMNAADASSPVIRNQVIDFYRDALHSRLNNQDTGCIVSVQQRLHEDDFPAFLLGQGNWRHVNLKAIAETTERHPLFFGREEERSPGDVLFPQRQSRERLDAIRQEIGNPAFSAQYQQEPVTPEGALFRLDKFHFYDEEYERDDFNCVLQSWDTAFSTDPKADFSVCTTWGHRDEVWYLIDVWRKRVAFPDLVGAVKRLRQTWRADYVVVEAISSGLSLMQHMRSEDSAIRSWMRGYKPRGDKTNRAAAQTAQLESGRFQLPSAEKPWRNALLQEFRAFPDGKYDDQVDSIIQAIHMIVSHRITLPGGTTRRNPIRSQGMPRSRLRTRRL